MTQGRARNTDVWFYGTLGYCLVIALVAWLMNPHHSGGGIMPRSVRMLFAPAMLSFAAQAIYAGQVRNRWGAPSTRDDNPIAFWISVSLYLALSCVFLFSALILPDV